MLGSAYEPPLVPGWGPSLAGLLADRGWGPVHMAAGVGFQAGKMIPNNPGANMSLWLMNQRSLGFDPVGDRRQHGAERHHRLQRQCRLCRRRHSRLHGHRRRRTTRCGGLCRPPRSLPIRRRGTRRCRSSPPSAPTSRCGIGRTFYRRGNTDRLRQHPPAQGPASTSQRSTLIAADVTSRLEGSRHIGPEVTPPVGGGRRTSINLSTNAGRRHPPDGSANLGRGHADGRSVGARAHHGRRRRSRRCRSMSPPSTRRPPDFLRCSRAGPTGRWRRASTSWPAQARGALSHDVVATTGSRVVRLQQHGHRRRRRSARVCSCPAGGLLLPAGHTRSRGRHPQHGQASTIVIQAPPGATAVAATLTVTGSNVAGFLTAFPCWRARYRTCRTSTG